MGCQGFSKGRLRLDVPQKDCAAVARETKAFERRGELPEGAIRAQKNADEARARANAETNSV